MKCGWRRRACARSISSRIAETAFGSIPSEVSLRSATSFSNLDSLLRQTYLFQDGVMDNGPSEEELRFMLADLRANTERLKLALKKLP